MTPIRFLPSLLLGLAIASPAAAQGTANLQTCRALTDPGARLACYDALPLPPAPAAAPPGPGPSGRGRDTRATRRGGGRRAEQFRPGVQSGPGGT
ncbi:MAG: hypothetical protein ACOZJX_12660 [Pseudomonadota bacterium]